MPSSSYSKVNGEPRKVQSVSTEVSGWNVVLPGCDMLRAVRQDRGVLIRFRLTWTAAKIRAELGNHDVHVDPERFEEGRKKKREKLGGRGVFIIFQ
ncbi:unnamed protein product [Penicillium nalgiovense]|nr:unnamed protein product [Penicillium nalgiovense]